MVPMRTTRHGNSEVLVCAKMVAVVPVDHCLATRKVLNPEDFEGQRFISMAPLIEAA